MYIDTLLLCNGIVFFSASRSNELGPSNRIGEDLQQLATSLGDIDFIQFSIKSKKEFIEIFQSLEIRVKNGFLPILHFDAHGSKENGLEIGETGEFLSWDDLTESLRKINIISGNNLFVFVAVCYGFYLINSFTIKKPCPFLIMFGPEDIITVGEIESSVVPFYTSLFKTKDIHVATRSFNCKFEYFHAEHVLFKSFVKYIHDHCRGQGLKERQERLLTEAFETTKFENTKINRRMLRKEIKENLKPTSSLKHKFTRIFLHGKNCSVSFAKIMSEVRRSYAQRTY